jgi:hypothetical protein
MCVRGHTRTYLTLYTRSLFLSLSLSLCLSLSLSLSLFLSRSRKRVFIERRYASIRRRELFRRLRVTRLLEIDDDAGAISPRSSVISPGGFHPPATRHPRADGQSRVRTRGWLPLWRAAFSHATAISRRNGADKMRDNIGLACARARCYARWLINALSPFCAFPFNETGPASKSHCLFRDDARMGLLTGSEDGFSSRSEGGRGGGRGRVGRSARDFNLLNVHTIRQAYPLYIS